MYTAATLVTRVMVVSNPGRRRFLKVFLSGALVCFAAAAAGTSYVVIQQTAAAHRLSRYDIAWDAGQGAVELLRFETTASRMELGMPGGTPELLQLRYEILKNRVAILNRPEFADFMSMHGELGPILSRLATAVTAVQPFVANPHKPGAIDALLETLQGQEVSLGELSSLAANSVSDNFEYGEVRLRELHLISTAVMGVLIILGLTLIIVLFRDNRLMVDNFRRLTRVTEELQRAGAEVASAHRAIASANDELHAQNLALRSRDEHFEVQNGRFDAALNNISQGLLMVDRDGGAIVCNEQFLRMFDMNRDEVPPGRLAEDLFEALALKGMISASNGLRLVEQGRDIENAPDHKSAVVESKDRLIKVEHQRMGSGGWVATFEDVSEQMRQEAHTSYLAHHDTLTGLANRFAFKKAVEAALLERTPGKIYAYVLVDLDNFKDVNDTLGHIAGDTLLTAAATRLRGCVDPGDIVARLGGDEFAIFHASPRGIAEIEELARQVVASMVEPFNFEGHRIAAGASVGIALCTDEDSADAERLLRNADMALYHAKAEGRGMWRFFTSHIEETVRRRAEIATEIRAALDRREFELAYQPIFSLETGELRQFEALIRWRHPRLGYVTPDSFIPIAEETQLILPMGEWVIGEACRAAMSWPDSVRIAVNLSPIQFRSAQLPLIVKEALERSGLPARRLEFEVTEGALLRDVSDVRIMLRDLRNLGVTVALDDFGTGYASLSYLQKFPFDKIKIDRSFVSQMVERSDSLSIVESIVHLAAKLGIAITAEGIETVEQMEILRNFGCNFAQGYLFDKPQPFGTVLRKITDGEYKPAAHGYFIGTRRNEILDS